MPIPRVMIPPSAAGSQRNWAMISRDADFGGTKRQALALRRKPASDRPRFMSRIATRPGIASAIQIQGKELSYNNLNDTDAAFELVSEFTDSPAIAIIKHANPCGVALGPDLLTAYQARACLRSRQRVWRHYRLQPAARCRDRQSYRGAFRRSHHRAGSR